MTTMISYESIAKCITMQRVKLYKWNGEKKSESTRFICLFAK